MMREFYRRHLPHWQPQGAVFFVTFRLKDSLPYSVIESLREEREWEKLALETMPEAERAQADYLNERRSFGRWDACLDIAEFGPKWLSQPEIAGIVKDAFHHRDGKDFNLYAFSIMSNHVHAVFEPFMVGRIANPTYAPPDVSRIGNPTYVPPDVSRIANPTYVPPDVSRIDNPTYGNPTYISLAKIMQSLKRHTARQSNLILGRQGAFWQDESYWF